MDDGGIPGLGNVLLSENTGISRGSTASLVLVLTN